MKICVLGLGEVGLPTAEYMSGKGLEVYCYDISQVAVDRASSHGLRAFHEWKQVPKSEVYIVCVSTSFLYDDGKPDLSPVFDAAEKISHKSGGGTLISIESTIIPGTSRKIHQSFLSENIRLVHVPHRYWAGDPIKHGVKQLRVIGGIDKNSLDAGVRFYRALDIPLHEVSTIEIAEMCKIAENSHRYVQVAFAEELRMTCESLKLDFEELRAACNTKWNVEVLESRDGIGGHCLPKDIRYLTGLSEENILLNSALEVDRRYRDWLKMKRNAIGSAEHS